MKSSEDLANQTTFTFIGVVVMWPKGAGELLSNGASALLIMN